MVLSSQLGVRVHTGQPPDPAWTQVGVGTLRAGLQRASIICLRLRSREEGQSPKQNLLWEGNKLFTGCRARWDV